MSALIVELPPLESATEVVRRHLFPDSLADGPTTQQVLLEELSILLALYLGIDNGLDYDDAVAYLEECDYYSDCEAVFEDILKTLHWREASRFPIRRLQVLTTRGLVALYTTQ